MVFLNRDHGHPFHCNDRRIRVVETQLGTEVFIKSLEKELGDRDILDYNELKPISRSVILEFCRKFQLFEILGIFG